MLDRAPVLLGARRNLAREGDDAVGVGAIGAVELLQRIEIGEMVAVEHEIVGAFDLGDAIDRKAYRLKNTDEEIEQQKRNDAGVDHRRGQHHQRVGPEQVGQQLLAQLPVAAQQLFFECDTAMLEADAQLCAALGELGVELAFEPADFSISSLICGVILSLLGARRWRKMHSAVSPAPLGRRGPRPLGIYRYFTCGICAQTVHWPSCAAAVFLPLGLDGGVNPPPYAHRAPQGALFFMRGSEMTVSAAPNSVSCAGLARASMMRSRSKRLT